MSKDVFGSLFEAFCVAIVLLAAAPGGAQVRSTPAKAPYTKLESALAQVVVALDAGEARGAAVARLRNALAGPSAVPVTIRTEQAPQVLDWLGVRGAGIANVASDVIEAYVPPNLLKELDDHPSVTRVSQIRPPGERVVSQGVTTHRANIWHAAGYSGAGVRVGIIDSFQGFSPLAGTELPASVTARCYSAVGVYSSSLAACQTGSYHGTAVAESLIDIAPSVQLFISNPRSYLDLRNTVDWMTSQGVRVINYSLANWWDGPGDGTSPYFDSPLRTVDAAVAGGAVFVAAAGNEGTATYLGPFTDANHNSWGEFGGIEDDTVVLQAGETIAIQLRWEDSWTNAARDLDLFLYDPAGNLVALSVGWQDGGDGRTPFEALVFTTYTPGTYRIGVQRYAGTVPGWVQLQNFTSQTLGRYTVNGSIGNPAESANAGLIAVGAAPWSATTTIEPFSSRGPTPDGRTKPDLVGADRADTVTYGTGGFAGTSQATPHVAGLAALVWQAYPSSTPVQVSGYLKSSAAGRGGVMPNNTWGYGFASLPDIVTQPGDDFDGDGRADIAVFRPSTGMWYVVRSSTDTGWQVQWGWPGDTPVPGDYDGDRQRDVAVYRPSTGVWYVIHSSRGTGWQMQWGWPDDVPVPADYDGDGKADVAVYRPSTGVWHVVHSRSGTGWQMQWGWPGDVPVPADYDGDRRADIAVYRPANGIWYVLQSSTGTMAQTQWGWPSDIPVVSDYDGDGRADIAVYRPSTGVWYVVRSSTGTSTETQWGWPDDEPMPADYDGDGRADITVYRPSTGTWYQLRSTTGTMFFFTWGIAGDLPLRGGSR